MTVPLLLGFAWFFDSVDVLWGLYFTTTLAAFAVAVLCPRSYYRRGIVRKFVLGLYVGAICLTLPVMVQDLTLINYPDYPAFFLRGVSVTVTALMIVEAARYGDKRRSLMLPADSGTRPSPDNFEE